MYHQGNPQYTREYYENLYINSTTSQLAQGGLLAGNVVVNQILNYLTEAAAKLKGVEEEVPIPVPIVGISPDGYETLGVSIPIPVPETPLIISVELTFTGNVQRQDVIIDGNVSLSLGPLSTELIDLNVEYDHINNVLVISGMLEGVVLESLVLAIPGLNILLAPFLPIITPLAALFDLGATLYLDFNYHEGNFTIDITFEHIVRTVIKFVCEHIFHARITTSSLLLDNTTNTFPSNSPDRFYTSANQIYGSDFYNQNYYYYYEYDYDYYYDDELLFTSNWLTDAFNTVVHGVEHVASTIGHGIESAASTVAHGVETAVKAVEKEAVVIGKGIEHAAETVWHGIEYVGEKIWSGLKDAINWIDNAIKALGEEAIKIWNAIKNALKSLSVDSVCNFLYQTHKIGPFNFNLPGSKGGPNPKTQPTVTSTGEILEGAEVLWGYRLPQALNHQDLTSYCKQNDSQIATIPQLRYAYQNSTELTNLINMTSVTGNPKDSSSTINYAFCYGKKPSFVQNNNFIALTI